MSAKISRLGPAGDVHSIGAILYELLTGRPPFQAATPLDTILLVINTEPIAPRHLPPHPRLRRESGGTESNQNIRENRL